VGGHNLDIFSIIVELEQQIKNNFNAQRAKVKRTNSFSKGDTSSYVIDYEVASTTASGGSCSGTIFIRGMKGKDGVDSFKFVLEKSVDFADLDSQLFI
jgi:hypothetical protein